MSYWEGNAPGYSRVVEQASAAVTAAEKALLEALKAEYPLQQRVRVVHSRGRFYGKVAGWDAYGSRVYVRNEVSGKASKWWASHVELVGA